MFWERINHYWNGTLHCPIHVLDPAFSYLCNFCFNDRYKISFTTPWWTYAYVWMPFELTTAKATFQCTMDFVFSNEYIAVYQDDITIFLKNRDDHIGHLARFLTSANPWAYCWIQENHLGGLWRQDFGTQSWSKDWS